MVNRVKEDLPLMGDLITSLNSLREGGKEFTIIGFSGKMGSGKTTAATFAESFARDKGYNCDKVKLATPVYAACRVLGQFRKDRVMLQTLGNIARKRVSPDVFCRLLLDSIIKRINQDMDCFIIDDVRFINEIQCLQQVNAILIKVEADADIRKDRIGTAFVSVDDVSETEMDSIEDSVFSGIIKNEGVYSDLRDDVVNVLEPLVK